MNIPPDYMMGRFGGDGTGGGRRRELSMIAIISGFCVVIRACPRGS